PLLFFFFFSSRRRHTRSLRDWSSDVCSSDLMKLTCRSLDDEFAYPFELGDNRQPLADGVESADHLLRPARGAARRRAVSYTCIRSEERRVGKECRSRWWRGHEKKTGRSAVVE